jgi:hypothetical protein
MNAPAIHAYGAPNHIHYPLHSSSLRLQERLAGRVLERGRDGVALAIRVAWVDIRHRREGDGACKKRHGDGAHHLVVLAAGAVFSPVFCRNRTLPNPNLLSKHEVPVVSFPEL